MLWQLSIKNLAIIDDINRLGLAEFATKLDDGLLEIDYFAIDNYYNNERVKRYYLSGNALKDTYSGAYPFTFRQPIKHKIAFKSTILYPFIP